MFRRLALAWAGALALVLPSPLAAEPHPSLTDIRVKAEAGDAEAQNELGSQLLATGDETKFPEARAWFRRAFEGGSVEGANNYASMLTLGTGGPANEAEGKRLREQAASRGSVGANLTIAERYIAGAEGYPRDHQLALKHVRAAAESSHPMAGFAQWKLGMMYLQGVGTTANAVEAYRWVSKAADGCAVQGMISRAVMLATGEGVAENDLEARDWYKRASESGDVMFPHALRGLGAMLVNGEGGPADLPRGIAYLRIAAAGNDTHAPKLLELYRDKITDDVDQQAREIADQWMAQHLPIGD